MRRAIAAGLLSLLSLIPDRASADGTIEDLLATGVPQAYVTSMTDATHAGTPVTDPVRIFRAYGAGIPAEAVRGFTDTALPNALVVYPFIDEWEAFTDPNMTVFFSRLRQHYDLAFRVARTDTETAAIAGTTPMYNLLILAGHGTQDGIALGAAPGTKWLLENYEELYLDRSDAEIGELAKSLLPGAPVVLISCSTAKGDTSFADWLSRILPGHPVYASAEDFASWNISVDTWNPFRISFYDCRSMFENLFANPLKPFRLCTDYTRVFLSTK